MEIIFAGQNKGKFFEFQQFFENSEIKLNFVQEKVEVEEFGSSLRENAYIKARNYYQLFKNSTLADDSGLFVDKLGDQLGVESANFGGKDLTDRSRCELLIEKMLPITKKEERSAYFECCLCFYKNSKEIYFFQGRMQGSIAFQLGAGEGFGYDEVFIPLENINPEEKTLAQLGVDWKNEHSHRKLAILSLKKFFSFTT